MFTYKKPDQILYQNDPWALNGENEDMSVNESLILRERVIEGQSGRRKVS